MTWSKNHDEAMIASTPEELASAAFSSLASTSRNAQLTAWPVTPCCRKDLSGVQRHPQPDTLLVRMRAVMRRQRRDQRGREQLHEQALGDLGRKEDEDAVPAVLVSIWRPGEFGLLERLTHRPVQPFAYR